MPEIHHTYIIAILLGLSFLYWLYKSTEITPVQLCDNDILVAKIRNLTRVLDENKQNWKFEEENLKSRLFEARRQLLDFKRTKFFK